ncbi:lipocalin/fatty-acid binding family protein [Bacteroides sp. 519]|uniref:lipocalin/fatty-acid binding family protein n=1 Tax=Bacteroides sp. 519 TaxID=2302937 RepID=UPI0013D509DE|nr:lipocalin/fatty-acid binding family protein [Bacteroides sp. 519]NDV60791.1 lipocalin/fatty-acid binding family protein [Bacteroides sp. 519]
MVKFLLLALAFGLAHADPQIAGQWNTIAIAADNVDKVEEGKELRLYVREISCNADCTEMGVTFYVKANGQCSKTTVTGYKQEDGTYKTQFEGDNRFEPVYVTSENIVFVSKNADRSGRVTHLIFVVGKGEPLTSEQQDKLETFSKERGIPSENIQNVLATDTCPK